MILKYSSGKGVTKGTFRTSVDGEAGFIEVSTPVSDEAAEGERGYAERDSRGDSWQLRL